MYTEQMKKAVREIRPPKDFEIGIVDYGKFLTIQFYESHWRHLGDPERLRCIKYMNAVKNTLELMGASVTLDPILDIKYNDDRKIE
jgi:hypothetical protein